MSLENEKKEAIELKAKENTVTNQKVSTDEAIEKTHPLIVVFNKPYLFEGLEYSKLELLGLEKLKAKDLAEADKLFITQGNMAMMNEMTSAYAFIIASKASGRPIEFVEGLPIKEAMKIKSIITDFLYN